jgi:hypothetical protein
MLGVGLPRLREPPEPLRMGHMLVVLNMYWCRYLALRLLRYLSHQLEKPIRPEGPQCYSQSTGQQYPVGAELLVPFVTYLRESRRLLL